MGSVTEDAVVVQDGRKVMKERLLIMLSDYCHRCSTVRHRKVECGNAQTELSQRVTQVLRRDGHSAEQFEAVNLSQITSTSMANVSMERSFLNLMKAVLNYAGAFQVGYCVSFAQYPIKDIADDIMPAGYLTKQSRSKLVQYARFGGLMKNNSDVLSLLELLREGRR